MAELPAKGSLPHGWQVKPSKKYPDRVYYFNVLTGASTWECPILDLPKEELKQVKKQSISPKVGSQPEQVKKALIKVQDKSSHESSNKRKATENPSSAPNDASSKASVPTAVVVPVIHKHVKFNLSAKPKLLPSKEFVKTSNSQKLKRKVDQLYDANAIVQNTSAIAQDTGVIEKNIGAVAQNTCVTQQNTSAVAQNPGAVAQNTGAVAQNTGAVAQNTGAVAQNMGITVKKKRIRKRTKKKKICSLKKSDQKETPKEFQVKISEVPTDKSLKLSIEAEIEKSESVPSENKDVEDIEMLDVSLDIMQDLAAKKETIFVTVASYYIVLDTNVLVNELNLVNELKDTPMNGCGPPHIFIPWIVVKELDHLKSKQSTNKTLMRNVCEAIRYLNSVLLNHPRFHGQTPMEVKAWEQTFSENNDDRILECCMGLGEKMPKEKVILLTNDKNLVNKCLILKINVHNWKSMMKSVKPDVKFHFSENVTNASKKKRKKNQGNNNGSTNEAAAVSEDDQKILQDRDVYKREIHTIMCTARQLLKDNLSNFLEIEMHEAYGSTWLSFPIKRDLLDGILAAILKYWKTVFSSFMTEKVKRNFELLHGKVNQPTGLFADEKEECLAILSSIEDIFWSIKRRRPNIEIPIERVQEFRVAVVDCFNTYNEIDGTIKQAEQESALALFERNWIFINLLSGIVLDTCGIPHDFQYDKPSQLFTDVEVRQVMCEFYPSLLQLKKQMFEMHTAIQECKPTKNITRKLSETLLNFIPSIKLPYEPFASLHFSARALELFCTNPQNKQMIEIGYKQVEKYFVKLDEALVALMLPRSKRICSPETMICD